MQSAVGRFLKYYENFESRPVFETVDEMLKWAGLNNLTASTLAFELDDAGLSALLIQELVTVTTTSHLLGCLLPNFFCLLLMFMIFHMCTLSYGVQMSKLVHFVQRSCYVYNNKCNLELVVRDNDF